MSAKQDFTQIFFRENGPAFYGPTVSRKCFLSLLKHLAFDDAETRQGNGYKTALRLFENSLRIPAFNVRRY